jgi:hypothetical protein
MNFFGYQKSFVSVVSWNAKGNVLGGSLILLILLPRQLADIRAMVLRAKQSDA